MGLPRVVETAPTGTVNLDELRDVMRMTLFPEATDAEMTMFAEIARSTGLNPFLKEIYPIKDERSGRVRIEASAAGLERLANQTDGYRGYRAEPVYEHDEFSYSSENGKVSYKHVPAPLGKEGKVIAAYCYAEHDRFDFPLFVLLRLEQRIQRFQNGTPKARWGIDPAGMLVKCAKAAFFRMVLPHVNLYVGEEMSGVEDDERPQTPQKDPRRKPLRRDFPAMPDRQRLDVLKEATERVVELPEGLENPVEEEPRAEEPPVAASTAFGGEEEFAPNHRAASFALFAEIEERVAFYGVTRDDFAAYTRAAFGVDSRSELTAEQWESVRHRLGRLKAKPEGTQAWCERVLETLGKSADGSVTGASNADEKPEEKPEEKPANSPPLFARDAARGGAMTLTPEGVRQMLDLDFTADAPSEPGYPEHRERQTLLLESAFDGNRASAKGFVAQTNFRILKTAGQGSPSVTELLNRYSGGSARRDLLVCLLCGAESWDGEEFGDPLREVLRSLCAEDAPDADQRTSEG